MLKRLAILVLLLPIGLAACGQKEERKKQVGPLKDWIVGSWVRNDDPIAWIFGADGIQVNEPIPENFSQTLSRTRNKR